MYTWSAGENAHNAVHYEPIAIRMHVLANTHTRHIIIIIIIMRVYKISPVKILHGIH
jgi:hypothetical protein